MQCTNKHIKHIGIRYFCITAKVKSGEVTIEYYPAKEMIANFFTKFLAGALFKKFIDIILGINNGDTPKYKAAY